MAAQMQLFTGRSKGCLLAMVLDKDVEVGVEFAGLLIEEFSRRSYDRLSPGVLGGVSHSLRCYQTVTVPQAVGPSS